MPVLNGMPYLRETLQGIRDSTDEPIELYVWENGSTDGSLEELRGWIPSIIPGKIFTGGRHGVGGSLRELVKKATTEFCARIDADDVPLPGRIDLQLAFLDAHPDVAVVGGQMKSMDEHSKQGIDLCIYPLAHERIMAGMLAGQNSIAHPAVMFRRNSILDIGNYHELPNVEDYDLWLRVATKYRLANLPIALTCYRIHSNSVTRIATADNRLQELVNQTLINQSEQLFGWRKDIMALFIKSQLIPLFPEASNLKIPSWKNDILTPLYTPDFIDLFEKRLHVSDFTSMCYFAYIDPRKYGFFLAAHRYIKKCIVHLYNKYSITR